MVITVPTVCFYRVAEGHSYQIRYLYDAAGNKMQKQVETFDCPPNTQCPPPGTATTDYLGNFYYENGNLRAVYYPHGLIRPTPPSAENTTDYVYDYYIKDYLGNVRVVLTEENATYETAMVATMEEYRAEWEEENFENIEEGREPVPYNYPVDASFPRVAPLPLFGMTTRLFFSNARRGKRSLASPNEYLHNAAVGKKRPLADDKGVIERPSNQYIAKVVADSDMTIGPSKVLEVSEGDKVQVATQYFFEENAPGATYEDLGFLIEEILVSMAAAGAGVLPVGEGALLNLINGNTSVGNEVFQFLSTKMDTTDMTRPHGYLVWLAYDKNFNLVPDGSGALRVTDPNELGTLFSGEIPIAKTGYLHVYVSNGTEAKTINFDNLYITTMQGKTRQINHYYPYGLRMRMGHGQRYTQMYTTKELQTGEYWDASVSTGLEMYDFDARFYDPQLGRWFVGDPAEQFHNPYLAMGNNPVVYVDPDGEFVHLIIGAAIGGMMNLIMNADKIENPGQFFAFFGVGALAGGLSAGVGAGVNVAFAGGSFGAGFAGTATGVSSTGILAGATTGAASGITSGFISGTGNTLVYGGNIGDALNSGLDQAWKQGASGAILGGVFGGIDAYSKNLNVLTGKAQLDLSSGVGAHGNISGSETVVGKYVGKYEHDRTVSVFETSQFDEGTGITIPGRGIVVSKGAYTKGLDPWLMKHEYGHILQARKFGNFIFYQKIAPNSLYSATKVSLGLNHSHSNYWTEVMANNLSYNYFGNPGNWPTLRFPLEFTNYDWVPFLFGF